MDLSTFWRWLRGELPPARYADHAVARQVYADYMRAQILGLKPSDSETLLAELSTVGADGTPEAAPFPDLMGVETRLATGLDDDMVEQAYWIVRERFNRVAPVGVIEEHSRWAPPGLVEPDDRMPIAGTTGTANDAGKDAGTTEAADAGQGDDSDTAEPAIDATAIEAEAAACEAEARHEQALALAAEPPEGADDTPPAPDARTGPLPEDQ